MISGKGRYEFTDEEALKRIKVDGDILPLRNQQGTLRSEDVTFLNECRNERLAAMQYDPDGDPRIRVLHVPRLTDGAIVKDIFSSFSGYWHSSDVLDSSGWLLVSDASYDSGGIDIMAQISSLTSAYQTALDSASAARASAKADAEDAFKRRKGKADEALAEKISKADEDWEKAVGEENERYEKSLRTKADEHAEDVASIEDEIERLKADESIDPADKIGRIAAKRRELAVLDLEYEKFLYDGTYTHEGALRDIDKARRDSIADAQAERDAEVAAAQAEKDEADRQADETYDRAVGGPAGNLANAVRPVMMNPSGYTGGTVQAAQAGAGLVGVSIPGAEAWNSRINDSAVDRDHSASYAIGRASDVKLHHALLIWALYSDYEHMEVLRTEPTDWRGDAKVMKWRKAVLPGWDDSDSVGEDALAVLGNTGGEVGYRSTPWAYNKVEDTSLKMCFASANRKMVGRLNYMSAHAEVEYEISGDDTFSGGGQHIVKTYRAVVDAELEEADPAYWDEFDGIDDAYSRSVEANEKRRDARVARRRRERDLLVDQENAEYEAAVDALAARTELEIKSVYDTASAQIGETATKANTDAMDPDASDPNAILAEGARQCAQLRWEMDERIRRIEAQRDARAASLRAEHERKIGEYEDACEDDIRDIEAECDEANRVARNERQSKRTELYTRWNDEITAIYIDHEDAVSAARQEAERQIHELDPSSQGYEDQVKRIHAAMVAEINSIVAATADALNEHGTSVPSGRLCAKIDFSSIFGMGVNIEGMRGMLRVRVVSILLEPALRTLTFADFARFDPYYGADAVGPDGGIVEG